VTLGDSLLGSGYMPQLTHPLVSRLAPLMNGELGPLHQLVAECVLQSPTDRERSILRYFGAELGAVQRRIRLRTEPPTKEEVEIALTAVLALMHRRSDISSMVEESSTIAQLLRIEEESQLS